MSIPHRFWHRSFWLATVVLLGLGTTVFLLALPAAAAPDITYDFLVDTAVDSNDPAYQQCFPTVPDDCSLRGAVSRVNAGAAHRYTITLPAGVFTLTLAGAGEDNNATGDLDIAANVDLVIVGDAAGSTVQAGTDADNGIDRVFHVFGGLTLADVTVRYGRTNGFGGGILTTGALTLTNVTLFANTAVVNGGGLSVNTGTAVITGSQFLSNTAHGVGGGLHMSAGTAVITGSQFLSNTTSTLGGAIAMYNAAALALTGCNVDGNVAATAGGGLLVDSGVAVLRNVHIGSNQANFGGGVRLRQSSANLTFTNGVVENNVATKDGGGLYLSKGQSYLASVVIYNNLAQVNGGGAYLPSGATTITGGSILSNTAVNGGGVYAANQSGATAAFTLTNSIVSGNAAGDQGGGIYVNKTTVLQAARILTNTAGVDGGGLYVDDYGQAVLNGGQIVSNTAVQRGGGIGVGYGTVALSGTQVLSNAVPAGSGGGVFIWRAVSRLSAVHALFQGNQASRGGGLFLESGGAVLTDTQFAANSAGYGGGVHLNQPTALLTATNVTLQANTASQDGGGLRVHQGVVVLRSSHIISNSGNANGGGAVVNLASAALSLVNSELQGNAAGREGGGVFVNQGTAVLTDTRIISNRAGSDGGGIKMVSSGVLTATHGCIVNNSDTGAAVDGGNAMTATGNWWGTADGPAGAGPGRGDSASIGVDYSGFLSSAPAGCPDRQPPTANAGSGQNVSSGAVVTLDGSASTALYGDALTYFWEQTGGTAVTFTPTLSRTMFTAPQSAGVLTFTLTVTDSHGLSDTAVTTVSVPMYMIYLPVVIRGSEQGTAALTPYPDSLETPPRWGSSNPVR